MLFSLLRLVDPSMQCGSDLGRYGRWNDCETGQGEIEQSASTFRSQSKGVTSRRQDSGPVDRAAPPRTTKGGCSPGRSGRSLRRGRGPWRLVAA